MTNLNINITEESKNLFGAFARDSVNWSGLVLVGGNVLITKEQRGNLTQLKKAGLVTTGSDGQDVWLEFTEDGERYANELNIHLGADHMYKINAEHFAN